MAAEVVKVDAIQKCFARLIKTRLARYQTAELLHGDGTWGSWPDLPIRIYNESSLIVSISWSRFDDLWLANDESLPFAAEDATTRWVDDGITTINRCLGQVIHSVRLGRSAMSIEDRQIEIWTRLAIELDDCWLEVFNALDENGYAVHAIAPTGDFVNCI